MSETKCDGNGSCLDRCCETCLNFRLRWSAAGSKHATLENIVAILNERACSFFVANKDDMAREMRHMASRFAEMRDEASKELQAFINVRQQPS